MLTMYHNPRCSKSRQTLELLKENGVEPTLVEYLQETPDASRILRLAELLGVAVAELLRRLDPRASHQGVQYPNVKPSRLGGRKEPAVALADQLTAAFGSGPPEKYAAFSDTVAEPPTMRPLGGTARHLELGPPELLDLE